METGHYIMHRSATTEPMLLVDTKTNRWHDNETGWSGDIIDLAGLKMNPAVYKEDRVISYSNT